MRGLGSGEPAGPSITLSRHVLVLALDTTTRAGSAALVEDGAIRHEIIGDESRTHGERLPRDLMRVLDEAGRSRSTPSICSRSPPDQDPSPACA